MKNRPNILTIAGFDPSGGAGVLADVKAIETNRCQAMAVLTANTIQTEDTFTHVNWVEEDVILEQLQVLIEKYKFDVIKIGLVPSLALLQKMIPIIKKDNLSCLVIWDPVLSVSAGFDFKHDLSSLKEILPLVDWVTPNWNEIKRLSGNSDAVEGAKELSEFTKVYLKGGHSEQELGKDFLLEKGNMISFNPKHLDGFEKHGSGCVFSATLAANLAMGYPKQKAVLKTKRYIEHFLKSNKDLLGRHK